MFTQNLPPLSGIDLQAALKLSENVLAIIDMASSTAKSKAALKELNTVINEANAIKEQSSVAFSEAATALAESSMKVEELKVSISAFNESKKQLDLAIEKDLKLKSELECFKKELEEKALALDKAKVFNESEHRAAMKLLKEKEQAAIEQKNSFEKLNSDLSSKLEKLKELTA